MIAKAMLLTSEEQDLLASLVGAVWDHDGAQAALEDGRYALVDMYVQTESGADLRVPQSPAGRARSSSRIGAGQSRAFSSCVTACGRPNRAR